MFGDYDHYFIIAYHFSKTKHDAMSITDTYNEYTN